MKGTSNPEAQPCKKRGGREVVTGSGTGTGPAQIEKERGGEKKKDGLEKTQRQNSVVTWLQK